MKSTALLSVFASCLLLGASCSKIDREALVSRHDVVSTHTDPKSPAQVGNGEFAFGADITGLQTFVPFNTMSQWGWHSFPLPEDHDPADFKGQVWDTHGRPVNYSMPNDEQPELSGWLAGNPHRINLGRIGFLLKKEDGGEVRESDLQNARQRIDLLHGLIVSRFDVEGSPVEVETACHPDRDMVAVRVRSPLLGTGRLLVRFEFPYATAESFADYVGDRNRPDAHSTTVEKAGPHRADLSRAMDDTRYRVSVGWTTGADFLHGDTIASPHRFYLAPRDKRLDFVCLFSPQPSPDELPSAKQVADRSRRSWIGFWKSGAAVDLSESTDPRWRELERRIVLSQYLLRVNEAGSLPPQESGLVNNGWYGRFHFEMVWWHMTHYALWDRWPLMQRCMGVYADFLPTSRERAAAQGYGGARWPKCTADSDRDWPHPIHATLIWQQPHPIYFAELDYRLHPGPETLRKWRDVVTATADFMADYAWYDASRDEYVLGPPVYIVSENTDPKTTINPAFESGYWRFGLRTARQWLERMGQPVPPKWDSVLAKLSPLPEKDGVYETYEGIPDMWTRYTFEHPALTGVFGMLPGDGVDTATFDRTLDRVLRTWDFNRTWGWDFPMIAMAAARSGKPETAVDMLLHSSAGFQFDEHGLATGGPFPYFPSNGALLTAVAMMAGGWDGSQGDAPGFPKNGKWVVRSEGLHPMP